MRLHALELGDPATRSRVVYLHGCPDHPPTARPFLEALVARGHRVWAPWLPGYSPSRPSDRYDLWTLAQHVVDAIDAWSPGEPVHLVGHDWGAVLTYVVCALHARCVRRAVTLAVPHPQTFVRRLLRDPRQLRASWYMALFQLPGAARLVARHDFALVDRLWRAWSPRFELPAADRSALHATLRASMPAPLAYYRAALRTAPQLLRDAALHAPIATPLLALHGANDGCILAPTDSDTNVGSGTTEIIPEAGHWLHLEDPGRIADRVSAWFMR